MLLRRGRKLTSCLRSGLIVTQQSGRWASRCRYPVPSTVWLVSWRVVGVSHLAWLGDGRLEGWPIRESVDGGRRSLNSVREGSGEESPEGDGRLPMSQAVAEWFGVTFGSRGGDGSGRKIRSGRGPSSPWLELNPAPRR